MASFALKTLLPVCAVYLAVACASAVIDPQIALALDVAAIFYGIFGPAVVNHGTSLDLSLISFPHLAERFELITIITFGEAVVTVAEVAEHFGFGTVSLMTFSVVVLLFGCYVVFMHNLVEHRQLRRGLRLIYCHFFIVIAVNLFTVSLNLLVEEPEPTLAVCGIGATATFQHTAARRRLRILRILFSVSARFNTQPPEGGCTQFFGIFKDFLCFNTQPPEGGCRTASWCAEAFV